VEIGDHGVGAVPCAVTRDHSLHVIYHEYNIAGNQSSVVQQTVDVRRA
jgi:hypothetical protein